MRRRMQLHPHDGRAAHAGALDLDCAAHDPVCLSRRTRCALRVRNMGRAEEGQGSNSTDMLSKVKLTGIEVAEPHEKAPACMAV